MTKIVFILTYSIGSYSDKETYTYAVYATYQLAEAEQNKLQEICDWHRFRQNQILSTGRDDEFNWSAYYEQENPPPPEPKYCPKKSSRPELMSMRDKEWVEWRDAFNKEQELAWNAYQNYRAQQRDYILNIQNVWWENEMATLPNHLLPYKDFPALKSQPHFYIEEINFYE